MENGHDNERGGHESGINGAVIDVWEGRAPEHGDAYGAGDEDGSHNDWSEPAYNEVCEDGAVLDMYTPGICVGISDKQRRKNGEAAGEREDSGHRRSFYAFSKAACFALLCVFLSAAATFGVLEYRIQRGDFDPPVQEAVPILGAAVPEPQPELAPVAVPMDSEISAEDIYEMARHQVVGIQTGNANSGRYFGQSGQPAVSGSGFIISSDGHILTNYHVIEPAHMNGQPITVYLEGETKHEAEIVGYDLGNDVAVIKIEAEGLSPVAITDSDGIRVGQRVYAIGNPFGTLTRTMTEGIVSARDRMVTVENKIINTFQISAAVNAGNSGGPVLNVNGEVIGIVTAKFMSAEVEGVGFAIPISDAFEIAASLIEHGYITGRPFLGITPQTVTRGYAEFFGWVEGVYVRAVVAGSAAEKAALMFGDIIIRIGEDEIPTREVMEFVLRKYSAGDTTSVTVWRGGEEVELTITFDEAQSAGQPQ